MEARSMGRRGGSLVFAVLVILTVGAAVGATSLPPRVLFGTPVPVGNGTARAYVDLASDGSPSAIGVALTQDALSGLATHMNTTSRCWDKNGDGHMSHGECLGDYEATLALPDGTAALDLPFRWITVNWNPEGHPEPAPAVWSWPHFDFHFFTAEPELIHSIRPGPCGEFIDCEDFERASAPLPADRLPDGYVDVGAAVPGMGNHLIDAADPEIADPSLGFSKTFIYGVYDGALIFLEPMISHAYLSSRPSECVPLRTPASYEVSGHYPTRYCIRYDAPAGEYRISLEGLVRR